MGSGLLAFALNGIDRLLIAEYVSMEALAIYSVALKFSIAIPLLMQPFGLWWMPKRFALLNQYNGHQQVLHYSMIGLSLSLF